MSFQLAISTVLFLCFSTSAYAQEHHHHMPAPSAPPAAAPPAAQAMTAMAHHAMGPADCGEMEVWDYSSAMCRPRAMSGMPMRMLMIHGNAFFAQILQEKPRGQNAFTLPNMFMVDYGSSVGDRHYFNVELMTTFEKWTYPQAGYPELLQIGESNEDHKPYLDAQHPHSSPIMGLTLSDTVSIGSGRDHAKVWFAPRGQATEGPVAFMHRPTGLVNPDAPLGHHVGQDVGHITSTVLGASARMAATTLELSTFNGTEPEPTRVDLPIGTPNSYAARAIHEVSPHAYAMASAAFIKSPEPHEPDLDHIWRYSASVYTDHDLPEGWMMHNTLIWGLVNDYDKASALTSFGEEFWIHKDRANIWSRIEVLQRTPAELAVPGTTDPNQGRWVTAVTLGYTHKLASWDAAGFSLGTALTKDFLPGEFQDSYGGNPLSGKIFLQVGGMKMWDL